MTVRSADCVMPFSEPLMVTFWSLVTALVWTEKLALADPAGISMLTGTAATPGLVLFRVIVRVWQPMPALDNVTVPLRLAPPSTLLESRLSAVSVGGCTTATVPIRLR